MDLLKLNIFRGGLFKQAKFLISTPQQAGRVFLFGENGMASMEVLPLEDAFLSADEGKKSWQMDHAVTFKVYKYGEPFQDEPVLLLSERTYLPLDPFNTIKPKEKEKRSSLLDIARLRHANVLADLKKTRGQQSNVAQLIIQGCFILLGLMLLGTFIAQACGGSG